MIVIVTWRGTEACGVGTVNEELARAGVAAEEDAETGRVKR